MNTGFRRDRDGLDRGCQGFWGGGSKDSLWYFDALNICATLSLMFDDALTLFMFFVESGA